MNANAMFKMTYGLYVLTARKDDKDNGCIIDTAMQAASEPNQVSIAINKNNYTHELVKETGEFTVSVMSEKASFDLFKRFGFQSGRNVDKFDGFTGMKRGNNGIYYVTEGTNAFISVKVEKSMDLGSHTMFVGTITDMEVLSDDKSITYEYYQENIKPKAENTKKGNVGTMKFYKCDICGNFVEMVKESGVVMTCCGQNMTELIPGSSDGAFEKHVPSVKVEGNTVKVNVGEADHPMIDTHYIEWIAIETDKGAYRKALKPNEAPKAQFHLCEGEKFIAAYSYCNLHGLWKFECC